MATNPATPQTIVPLQGEAGRLTVYVDRWIYVFMAGLIMGIVLIGFVPASIAKVQAVAARLRAPFPPILHVHAVLMGCWIALLLAQTTLMATGRKGMHMRLGLTRSSLRQPWSSRASCWCRCSTNSGLRRSHPPLPPWLATARRDPSARVQPSRVANRQRKPDPLPGEEPS